MKTLILIATLLLTQVGHAQAPVLNPLIGAQHYHHTLTQPINTAPQAQYVPVRITVTPQFGSAAPGANQVLTGGYWRIK